MRKVTVYNTIGGNLTSVETSAINWGDLQDDLTRRGITHNNMSAVVGETQVSLESPAGILPAGDFQLFLVPKKVKSGIDEYLIDLDGINWDDEDWNDDGNTPEDFQFKTKRDLVVARAKKAQSYLNKVLNYLITEEKKTSDDPEVQNLLKTAEQIKRNLGLYD